MEKKEPMKVRISTVLLIVAIIVIAMMAYLMYTQKTTANKQIANLENNATNMQATINNLQGKLDTISNTINSSQEEENNTANNNDKDIIDKTSYLEIQIDNSEDVGELSYTEPLKIHEESIIEDLRAKFNANEQYVDEGTFFDFESCPIVTFNLETGTSINVVGRKIDNDGFVFYTSTKDDFSDKTFYRAKSTEDLNEYIVKLYEDNK